MNDRKTYLIQRVPELLKGLKADMEPAFGIMSAQHMVEHLVWVTKSTLKDFGPPPEELNESQQGFMRFIQKGANFKYRPSDKKREDLDPPRMPDLEASKSIIPESIDRLYSFNEDHVFYNPNIGRLSFEEMELMHFRHYQWHLEEQFGLGRKE